MSNDIILNVEIAELPDMVWIPQNHGGGQPQHTAQFSPRTNVKVWFPGQQQGEDPKKVWIGGWKGSSHRAAFEWFLEAAEVGDVVAYNTTKKFFIVPDGWQPTNFRYPIPSHDKQSMTDYLALCEDGDSASWQQPSRQSPPPPRQSPPPRQPRQGGGMNSGQRGSNARQAPPPRQAKVNGRSPKSNPIVRATEQNMIAIGQKINQMCIVFTMAYTAVSETLLALHADGKDYHPSETDIILATEIILDHVKPDNMIFNNDQPIEGWKHSKAGRDQYDSPTLITTLLGVAKPHLKLTAGQDKSLIANLAKLWSDDQRKDCTEKIFGVRSYKDLTPPQKFALYAWLAVEKNDDTGEWVPNPVSVAEAKELLNYAPPQVEANEQTAF